MRINEFHELFPAGPAGDQVADPPSVQPPGRKAIPSDAMIVEDAEEFDDLDEAMVEALDHLMSCYRVFRILLKDPELELGEADRAHINELRGEISAFINLYVPDGLKVKNNAD